MVRPGSDVRDLEDAVLRALLLQASSALETPRQQDAPGSGRSVREARQDSGCAQVLLQSLQCGRHRRNGTTQTSDVRLIEAVREAACAKLKNANGLRRYINEGILIK